MSYTLDELCHIEKGKIGITKAVDGEFPLVTTGEDFGTHNEYHFEGPAVCVPLVSSTGHGHASIKRLHYVEGKFACGNILAVLIPKDPSKLSAKFLYAYLTSHKEEKLVRKMKGAANVSLTLTNLKKVRVDSLPSIEEQQKATKIFFKVGESFLQSKTLLEQSEYLTNNLLIKSLQRLFHVESYEKEVSRKDLPEGWVWKKLSEVAHIEMGQSPPGDSYNEVEQGLPLINGPVEFGATDFDNTHITKYTSKPTKVCEKGDLLICVRGSTTGRLNLASFRSCIGRGVASIRPKDANLKTDFLHYYLFMIKSNVFDLGTGSTFPNISKSDLNDIFIPIPNLTTQTNIVDRLLELRKRVEKMKQRISTSKSKEKLLRYKIWNSIYV